MAGLQKSLIHSRADTAQRDNSGRTALLEAVKAGAQTDSRSAKKAKGHLVSLQGGRCLNFAPEDWIRKFLAERHAA